MYILQEVCCNLIPVFFILLDLHSRDGPAAPPRLAKRDHCSRPEPGQPALLLAGRHHLLAVGGRGGRLHPHHSHPRPHLHLGLALLVHAEQPGEEGAAGQNISWFLSRQRSVHGQARHAQKVFPKETTLERADFTLQLLLFVTVEKERRIVFFLSSFC